jgi:hypothetical protein
MLVLGSNFCSTILQYSDFAKSLKLSEPQFPLLHKGEKKSNTCVARWSDTPRPGDEEETKSSRKVGLGAPTPALFQVILQLGLLGK